MEVNLEVDTGGREEERRGGSYNVGENPRGQNRENVLRQVQTDISQKVRGRFGRFGSTLAKGGSRGAEVYTSWHGPRSRGL